jgi:hypothetical protein
MDRPLVDSDPGEIEETEEPRGRRRWPVVVVSVVVVIVAIGAALYFAASHYQPLSQSLSGGYGSQILTSNGALASIRTAGAHGAVVWTEPSGTFHVEVIVTLNNDQRFAVTINEVFAPANAAGNSDGRAYFDSKPNAGTYGYKGGPPFKATTLASEGQLQLVVHWDQPCVPASDARATTYTSLPVEYTFEGFRHRVSVPIDTLTIAPRSNC